MSGGAMVELDLDTLRFSRGTSVHFVRDYEDGLMAEGSYAITYCGRWSGESHVVRQKFSAVRAASWCLPCYWNRHKAIDRKYGVRTS
jgi:hypothetical protein